MYVDPDTILIGNSGANNSNNNNNNNNNKPPITPPMIPGASTSANTDNSGKLYGSF